MGPGSFIGFTLQPVLKSKNVSKEGVEAGLLEPREQPYLFFGPWLSTAWSSEVCSGAGPRRLALRQGQGRRSRAQGGSLSSMSFWKAGEDPELRGRGLWFPQSPKRALLKHVTGALAKSRLASPLSFGDLVFQRGQRVMTPAPHPRGTR